MEVSILTSEVCFIWQTHEFMISFNGDYKVFEMQLNYKCSSWASVEMKLSLHLELNPNSHDVFTTHRIGLRINNFMSFQLLPFKGRCYFDL